VSETEVRAHGAKLLYTMEDLKNYIEQTIGGAQRLKLAQAFLQSMDWGIQGMDSMGVRIAFQILDPPKPVEYPKMLFRGNNFQIANNPTEEQRLNSVGFLARVPKPLPPPVEPERPLAPVISMRIPQREPDRPTEQADSEVSRGPRSDGPSSALHGPDQNGVRGDGGDGSGDVGGGPGPGGARGGAKGA
jgi:hypothetical protein